MKRILPSAASSRSVMMAVVLGTAVAATPSRVQANGDAATSDRKIDDISRYCQVCWRNARLPVDNWTDCTQQVLARLLEKVEQAKWDNLLVDESAEKKELMRAIDAVKKRTQRSRKLNGLSHDISDWRNELASDLQDRREALQSAATNLLSPRQQRIVELTCGGWGIPEIANELGTTVERISDEKYKAIRKLRSHFGAD